MIGKKINQLATELAPVSTDLTIIGDPDSGVSKKITLAQLGAIFSGAVSFYTNLAAFPTPGTTDVIYCAKDTQKLYLWSGSAYVEVFPSQSLLDTYQLRSEKGNANGYASLDSGGKVPISQLPSSIMEYKGTWNASTNTPTLANGTGDTGDVYICNVAGTVNFGAGAITFAVGDYVIYSGSIWQRSSGAVGTVTSVAASITGNSIGITGSPITTSGTLALAFAGTSAQYINGAGNLITFPTSLISGSGASGQVTFFNGANSVTGTNNFFWDATNNRLGIGTTTPQRSIEIFNSTADNHLRLSGNAPSVSMGEAVTGSIYQAKFGLVTTNGQFVSAGVAGDFVIISQTGATIIGTSSTEKMRVNTSGNVSINNTNDTYKLDVTGTGRYTGQLRLESTITDGTNTYTLPSATGTLALTSQIPSVTGYVPYTGATANLDLGTHTLIAAKGTFSSSGSGDTVGVTHSSGSGIALNITKGGNGEGLYINKTSGSGNAATIIGTLNATTLVKSGGTSSQFLKADGSVDSTSYGTGSVTSVGLSSATSGVTIGSTPITTSGTITLAIATASGSQQGLLSSTDWTTFNNKQNALTNPVTGTGTTNYLPKFTGASTIGNSLVFDNGSNVGIGTITPSGIGTTLNLYAVADTNSSLVLEGNNGNSFITILSSATPTLPSSIITKEGIRFATATNKDATGFSEKMRLNASGNLGLGVNPSAWDSIYFKPFEIGNSNSRMFIVGRSDTEISAQIGLNAYYQSGWKYTNTGAASMLYFEGAKMVFRNTASGTGGNALTWTDAMTLTSAGELCVGRTSAYGAGFLVNVEGNIYASAAIVAGSSVTAGTTAFGANGGYVINYSGGSGSSRSWRLANDIEAFADFQIQQSTTQTGSTYATKFYISPTGNVGIGTSSTGFNAAGLPLVVGSGSGNTGMTIFSGASSSGSIHFADAETTGAGSYAGFINYDHSANSMQFGTTGATPTEAMRITSGGTLLVGATSIPGAGSSTTGVSLGASGYITAQRAAATVGYFGRSNDGELFAFYNNTTQVGNISVAASSTSYNTSSDYRLKQDLKDFSGLDLVTKIKTYDYEWKSDKSRSYGVIAHELQSVINYAVTGVKDGKEMQGVDYSKIVPVLIKAIQELNDKIK
jgi:hypothetical protein